MTLIKTEEDIRFGGFTHIKIPSCWGDNFNDDKVFLFSLDYNNFYLSQKSQPTKHSNEKYRLIFENNKLDYPIIIRGKNFISQTHSICTVKNNVYDNFSYDYQLNKCKREFKIKEIEVYQEVL